MANTPFTSLVAGTSTASADILAFVDVSDHTQSAQGSTLKITIADFFAAIPVDVGVQALTATSVALAGATARYASTSPEGIASGFGFDAGGAARGNMYMDASHNWIWATNSLTNAMQLSPAGVLALVSLTASQAVFTDASKNLVSVATTGTGSAVRAASPTLTGTVLITGALLATGTVITLGGASSLIQTSGITTQLSSATVEVGTTTSTVGFYGQSGSTRQLLATGAGHTVDDVITALQAVNLVKQS